MELKLFDSERKVMEVLWDHGDLSAKELADRLKELVGWSKTTTYTVIKKCIDKKAVSRSEPGFVCHPLVSREEVREQETDALIDRMYGGSADLLVANLLVLYTALFPYFHPNHFQYFFDMSAVQYL